MTKFGNDLQNYVQMNPSVCLHPIRACQDMPDGSIYCTDCKTQVRPASEKPIDRIAALEQDREELINVAVKAFLLIEELGFDPMSERAEALDVALALGLNDALWEVVNTRALKEAKP